MADWASGNLIPTQRQGTQSHKYPRTSFLAAHQTNEGHLTCVHAVNGTTCFMEAMHQTCYLHVHKQCFRPTVDAGKLSPLHV